MTGHHLGGLPVLGRKTSAILRTRMAIVLAAQHVLAERGQDASIEDFAAQAEVSVSTLYKHYANKDDLVTAAFTVALNSWELWLQERMAGETDPLVLLVLPLRLFVRARTTHPLFASMVAKNSTEVNQRLFSLGSSLKSGMATLNATRIQAFDQIEERAELLLASLIFIAQKSFTDKSFTDDHADGLIAIILQLIGLDEQVSQRLIELKLPI